MHSSCYEWVRGIVEQYGLASLPTLEVGSGIVNGTVRDHFNGDYVGIDVLPGNGVDRVEDSEHLSDPDDAWRVVISTEMLEHVDRPWRCVSELTRVCAHGGHVIITCRGYDQRGCWEPHSWPNDTFRYSDRSLRIICEDAGLTVLDIVSDPEGPGWFVVASKA